MNKLSLDHLTYGELILQVILMGTSIAIGWWVIRASRDPKTDFNLIRLLMEKNSDGTWRESRRAVAELTGIVVLSWGFIYLVIANRLTEWYFSGYGFSMFGFSLWKYYLKSTKPPEKSEPTSGSGSKKSGSTKGAT